MILIGLVGSAADREAFAYEAQRRHGFSIAYSSDDLEPLQAQCVERCLMFGVGSADYNFIRDRGALVFIGDCDGCQVDDYVFVGCVGDAGYSARLSDLILAVCDDKKNISTVAA